MGVPDTLNGNNFTLEIKKPDDTTLVSSSVAVAANGLVTFSVNAIQAGAPVVGTAYRFNVVSDIFTALNYPFMTRDFTYVDAKRISNINELYVVGA